MSVINTVKAVVVRQLVQTVTVIVTQLQNLAVVMRLVLIAIVTHIVHMRHVVLLVVMGAVLIALVAVIVTVITNTLVPVIQSPVIVMEKVAVLAEVTVQTTAEAMVVLLVLVKGEETVVIVLVRLTLQLIVAIAQVVPSAPVMEQNVHVIW